jgi:hypothetical protein
MVNDDHDQGVWRKRPAHDLEVVLPLLAPFKHDFHTVAAGRLSTGMG